MAEDKQKSLIENMLEEFEKQEDCEVFFSVDGEIVGVHRVVLKFKGQALYEMAAGWTIEKEPIPVENMTCNMFKTLLRYMYSDEIPISNDNVFPLLSASKQLKMKHLEELCTDNILKSIGTDNVCTYMEEAINFKSEAIKKKCLEIFSKQTKVVLESGSFQKLSQPALSSFLDAGSTTVLEIALFWYVELWMKQKCKDSRTTINGSNMRKVIGDALYKIRFPTMTVQDFANAVTTIDGLLTDSEVKQVFQKITVFDNEGIGCPFSNKFRCQKNSHKSPVADMEQLCSQRVLYNNSNDQHCDFSSFFQWVNKCSDDVSISRDILSYRLVLQCFADLANSSPISIRRNDGNKDIRKKLHDAFYAWQITAKTKNASKIMSEFLEMRSQLNKICMWTLYK